MPALHSRAANAPMPSLGLQYSPAGAGDPVAMSRPWPGAPPLADHASAVGDAKRTGPTSPPMCCIQAIT